MAKHKYLDENGLLYLVQKIKTWLNNKVEKEDGKGLSTNDYTTDEKNKLSGIAENANNYTLPKATTGILGGIRAGKDVKINSSTGVLNVDRVTSVTYSNGRLNVVSVANGESVQGGGVDIHEGYSTTEEMNTVIDNKISSALTSAVKYKGTVSTYNDLPTNASIGDLYNVTATGDNYVWSGTEWDKQGGTIDLSNYLQDSDLVAVTNAEIDTIIAQ